MWVIHPKYASRGLCASPIYGRMPLAAGHNHSLESPMPARFAFLVVARQSATVPNESGECRYDILRLVHGGCLRVRLSHPNEDQ